MSDQALLIFLSGSKMACERARIRDQGKDQGGIGGGVAPQCLVIHEQSLPQR
jgi:hypothetical protein